jgi:hypothetical protein
MSEQISVPSQSTFDGANPMGNKANNPNTTIPSASQDKFIPSIQANILTRNIDNTAGLYENITQLNQLTPDYLLQSILQAVHSGDVYEAVYTMEEIEAVEYDVYTISHSDFTLRDYKRDVNNPGATPKGVDYLMKVPTGRDGKLSSFSFYTDTANTRRAILRVQGEYLQERPIPHTDTDYTIETYSFEKEILTSDGDDLSGLSCIKIGFNKVFLKDDNFLVFLADKVEKNTVDIANLQASKPIILAYNSTTVIDYSAGTFQFDDDTGQGVVTAGSVDITDFYPIPANNTPYYLFAVKNPTTHATTVIIDVSKTAPTLPAGFTKKKYIGAPLMTNDNGDIRGGKWFYGNKKFLLSAEIQEITVHATTATFPITAPPNTFAILDARITLNQNGRFRFYSNELPNSYSRLENNWRVGDWSGGYNNRTIEILLDNNAQIGVIEDEGGVATLYTHGWIDNDL